MVNDTCGLQHVGVGLCTDTSVIWCEKYSDFEGLLKVPLQTVNLVIVLPLHYKLIYGGNGSVPVHHSVTVLLHHTVLSVFCTHEHTHLKDIRNYHMGLHAAYVIVRSSLPIRGLLAYMR